MFNEDKLCKNLAAEMGKAVNGGKPNVGAALGKSVRGSQGAAGQLPRSVRDISKGVGKNLGKGMGRGAAAGLGKSTQNLLGMSSQSPSGSWVGPAADGKTVPAPAKVPRRAKSPQTPPPSGSVAGIDPAHEPSAAERSLAVRGANSGDDSGPGFLPVSNWSTAGQAATVGLVAGLGVWLLSHRMLFVAVGGTRQRRPWRSRSITLGRPALRSRRNPAASTVAPPRACPRLTADDRAGMPVLIGHRDGAPVHLDLATAGGLRLTGPGAHDAERALLVELMRCAARTGGGRGVQTLTGQAELARLLGEDFQASFTRSLEGFTAEPTSRDVLITLGGQVVSRQPDADTTSSADSGKRLAGLVCLIDPDGHAGPLRADLRLGAKVGVGAIVLGDWPHGTTLHVEADGLVTDAIGLAADGLDGVRMPLLEPAQARAHAAQLCGPAFPTSPAPGPAAFTAAPSAPPAVAPAAPSARVSSAEARPVEAPPGLVRLLGGYIVEGPGTGAAVHSADVRALLALLAEHRTVPLTRSLAEDKMWDGTQPAEGRFAVVIREARVKLTNALGRPSSDGTVVIRNTGTGYLLHPDLITCDVWQLRDLLGEAATAGTDPDKTALLTRAVDLYTGPYLPDLAHAWADTSAHDLAREVTLALAQLAALETAPERAARHLERATDLHPTAEHLHRARMHAYAEYGDLPAIHTCYDQLTAHLKTRGRRPEAATTTLYRQLTGQQ